MNKPKKALATALAACLGALSTGALATSDPHTYTFNMNTTLDIDNGSVLDYHTGPLSGRTAFFGSNGSSTISATVSAWRIEENKNNTDVSGDLIRWDSGLGVEQPDSVNVNNGNTLSLENAPWHGVDNNPWDCGSNVQGECDLSGNWQKSYTGEEFLIFDFGTNDAGKDIEVSLHSFLFGYAREEKPSGGFNNQADATVLRGVGGPGYSLNALTNNKATSAAGGFALVGNYSNVQQANLGSTNPGANAQTVADSGYSRYWAIGTLLTSLLTNSNDSDGLYEGAKLAQIVVKTKKPSQAVPVPATLGLLALGLVGLRRRNDPRNIG